jgi:hypothetical protein
VSDTQTEVGILLLLASESIENAVFITDTDYFNKAALRRFIYKFHV